MPGYLQRAERPKGLGDSPLFPGPWALWLPTDQLSPPLPTTVPQCSPELGSTGPRLPGPCHRGPSVDTPLLQTGCQTHELLPQLPPDSLPSSPLLPRYDLLSEMWGGARFSCWSLVQNEVPAEQALSPLRTDWGYGVREQTAEPGGPLPALPPARAGCAHSHSHDRP